MQKYLMIQSRSALASVDGHRFFDLAQALKQQGAEVEIMLVENGVLPARAGARAPALKRVLESGIPCLADAFALRERALPAGALAKGIKPAPLSVVVERMGAGWNLVWN